MSNIWNEILSDKVSEAPKAETAQNRTEFEKRNLAVPIYSEILNCEIWYCSNERMAAQVKRDDPEAVCYTTYELRELIKLDPGLVGLKKVTML